MRYWSMVDSPRGSKPISNQITEVTPYPEGTGSPDSSLAYEGPPSDQLTPVTQEPDTLPSGKFRTAITRDTDVLNLSDYELSRGSTLGDFEIFGKLGEGGMGTVFSAIHPLIGKRAAIKVLKHQFCEDPTTIERFITEARIVNQIGHPNIVDIFAFGEMPDGRRYFAMEWLVGETLRERLRRGRMSLVQMARTVKSVTRALEAAHDKRVIHRDIKPENIFLADIAHDEPLVKLLDFGVAKLANDKRAMVLTGRGQLLGTPMYIAPEQASSPTEVVFASDVYSLGAIAFECLTARPPFLAKNAVEMITAHLTMEPPAPSSLVPEVPEEIDRLVLEMLAKDPKQRPSLSHVRRMLELVSDPADLDENARRITVRRPDEHSEPFGRPFTEPAIRFATPKPSGTVPPLSMPLLPRSPPRVAPENRPHRLRTWGPWIALLAVLAAIAVLFAAGAIRLA